MWPNVRESQLLRSLLRTCHRSQFTPRATHIIYHGETSEGMTEGAEGGEGRLRDRESRQFETSGRKREREEEQGVERGFVPPVPPCPRCLYFYCGECSVASSVVFRNYDTIPLHPLERCTAARQSLYILRYNRSTSLPVKYITRLDDAEATAVNPLRFSAAVAYVRILCSRYSILSSRSPVYLGH